MSNQETNTYLENIVFKCLGHEGELYREKEKMEGMRQDRIKESDMMREKNENERENEKK